MKKAYSIVKSSMILADNCDYESYKDFLLVCPRCYGKLILVSEHERGGIKIGYHFRHLKTDVTKHCLYYKKSHISDNLNKKISRGQDPREFDEELWNLLLLHNEEYNYLVQPVYNSKGNNISITSLSQQVIDVMNQRELIEILKRGCIDLLNVKYLIKTIVNNYIYTRKSRDNKSISYDNLKFDCHKSIILLKHLRNDNNDYLWTRLLSLLYCQYKSNNSYLLLAKITKMICKVNWHCIDTIDIDLEDTGLIKSVLINI